MKGIAGIAGALLLLLILNPSAYAQCNAQPRLDQTNLNLGQILSSGASAGGCADGRCNLPPAPAAASAASSSTAGMGQQIDMDALVNALAARMAAQGFNAGGAKPLRVGSSAASASAVAGGGYYAPAPEYVPAPPAQPLAAPVMLPVTLALPANSATASSAVASGGGGGCGGGRGFFRRATRSRTRAVTFVNGQRTVSSSSAVSR
jgi:hypothetical protein